MSDEALSREGAHALALRLAMPADEPFLRELFRVLRGPQLALLPFDDAQRTAFCDRQYEARAAHYRHAYPDARHCIVENAGERIGSLVEARGAAAIHLVHLQMAPRHQAQGWGRELVRRLQADAARQGVGVALHVESGSRARSFYQRLGFTTGHDDGVYCEMSWTPPPVS